MAELPVEYEQLFKKGTIVEVSSQDEGLRGSWYTATVIRTLSRKSNKILIEYHNLTIDDAGTKPLREFADALLVRPIPPRDPPTRTFSVMEDVDAFHNDGWWEGVVTGVSQESPPRYAVFFRCSREQIEFTASDLRVHREWVRGNVWVPVADFSLSPCQNKKKGDDKGQRINGNISGDNDKITSNGEVTNAGRRSHSISRTQDGVAKNGHTNEKRKTSNCSGNKDVVNGKKNASKQRKSSNSNSKKLGVRRNGNLKEPKKRATTHASKSRPQSNKTMKK